MANKYQVVTPHGTFKRTSQNRTYTHVVVGINERKEWLEEGRLNDILVNQRNAKKYRDVIAGLAPKSPLLSIEDYKGFANNADARVAKLVAQGPYTEDRAVSVALGWAGRPDLAAKLLRTQSFHIYREVKAYDAVTGAEVKF